MERGLCFGHNDPERIAGDLNMAKNQVEFDLAVAELLVATGIVTSYDCDRVHASLRGGPGIREALLEVGATNATLWEAATQVVALIRQGKLPKEESRTVLHMVETGMSVAEALTKMGYAPPPANPWEDKLRELIESGKYKAPQ